MATVTAGNRFSTVTPDDHGGLIYIATFMAFTYSSVTFLTRCFIKWKIFGMDDWAIAAAQVFAGLQLIPIVVGLSSGLGKNLDMLDDKEYFEMARVMWWVCNILVGAVIAWGIASMIAISVGCSPSTHVPSAAQTTCIGWILRYKLVVAFDVITEVLLVVLPIYLVWSVQMGVKFKLRVVLAFSFRLPVAVLSILFLHYFAESRHSSNPGVSVSAAIIFQQAELGYSLIAATVPCLKSFIKSFDTGLGLAVTYATHPYGSGGYGGSYKMQSLAKGESIKSVAEPPSAAAGFQLDRTQNSTSIYHPNETPQEDSSIISHGSQEMIIRRDVQWDVRTDYVQPGTGK
ncbi:hypothetical protein AOQ84DRAFT_358631 [Glonium stellatum]|uniref:Rhodopsin domain-containing protein n=1 Tax=Glonium stellatum TaxID=574774 RepID=A0A8E2FCR0_9PEZI|nr:hypothetical protein AOQ84DRAFT_358631 [Glonium stellatum]